MTEPYAGQLSHDLLVTFSRPVIVDGTLKCVVGTVVTLNAVSSNIKALHPTKSSFAFVVNDAGRIIAYPDSSLNLRPASDLDTTLKCCW
jgi:methyl-accepting chemotaxis protein